MELGNLTQSEFDAHIANNTIKLAFIGMSNAGKSYRARMLSQDAGFKWHHVDGEIQQTLGIESMDAISLWLGYPTSATYPEREKIYLDAENKNTLLDTFDTDAKNLVFDTTGSVIYLPQTTIDWLKQQCLMVNLVVGEDKLAPMMEKFFAEPKPLIWSGFFVQAEGENEHQALEHSYPRLLHDRLARYQSLAHINIPAQELHDKSGQETLSIIRSHLATT